MTELEKVIKGLEYCAASCKGAWDEGNGCPYMSEWTCKLMHEKDVNGRCVDLLAKDALELLKAQMPRVLTLDEYRDAAEKPRGDKPPVWEEWIDGNAGWTIPQRAYEGYCTRWRAWTGEPSEEMREGTAWE